MEAVETVAGCMGGEHDKAALEQLSKRRERTFKLDAELTTSTLAASTLIILFPEMFNFPNKNSNNKHF